MGIMAHPPLKMFLLSLLTTRAVKVMHNQRTKRHFPVNHCASGAPLVKGIPFDPTDFEICGVDIFQKLVPMEAHEASSIYRYSLQ